MNKKKQKGFTLVEILITMSLLIILSVIMSQVLNAIGINNKARDAQRKKDLRTMKIAFEEYFNNKGNYPTSDIIIELNNKNNCKKKIDNFPTLGVLPCDPNGNPYYVITEKGNRFRIFANLENKTDKDVPSDWYSRGSDYTLFGKTINEINYGVSSSNVFWSDDPYWEDDLCNLNECVSLSGSVCGDVTSSGCKGNNCFYRAKQVENNCKICSTRCCKGENQSLTCD